MAGYDSNLFPQKPRRSRALYQRWHDMIKRCTKPNAEHFKHYGGRGITVSERWRKFENFAEDMGQPPFHGAQLDRIDNDGNYEPGNVKWSTSKQQHRNRRSNLMVEFRGQRKCLQEWADALGWPHTTLWKRLKRGWSVERALTEPPR